ncbi:MAG: 16S rRNA (cytosine(1402)-N(4))-methyltransferase RsmH [Pseudomonadota bacterium]
MRVASEAAHVPVLLKAVLARVAPVRGVWLDGTLGAGGYTRALLDAGADLVIALDRDPEAHERAETWAGQYGARLKLVQDRFRRLDAAAERALDGVVLDIGVSSMQLDQAARGFSFQKDGPLDMRMDQDGPSAADLVNGASEAELANILYHYGEERAARRIAKRVVAERGATPFTRTRALAAVIEAVMPPARPGQPHPATRSFQALRIAVNDELGELAEGLMAAERALAPDGWLVVITFHSLEDRIVKRFFQLRSGAAPRGSRHAPALAAEDPRFTLVSRRAVAPDEGEIAVNPRARSAKLRLARRTSAPAGQVDAAAIGLPVFGRARRRS